MTSELGYLKSELQQSQKKIEEMRTRKQVYAVPCATNDSVKSSDQRRREFAKSPAEELLQRIARAATEASQMLQSGTKGASAPEEPSCRSSEPLNSGDITEAQNRTCTLDSRSILIDNDLDAHRVSRSVKLPGGKSQTT